MKRSILKDKTKNFALRIIKMVEYIQENKKEYVMTKQVLRSGTSIGANVCEAFFGQTLPDFITKLHNARKESGETQYWLELLADSGKISAEEYRSINSDNEEIGRLLTSSIKTAESRLPSKKSYLLEPATYYGIVDEMEDLESFINSLPID